MEQALRRRPAHACSLGMAVEPDGVADDDRWRRPAARATGLATNCSWRSISESEPTSAISSVSATLPRRAANCATTRSAAFGSSEARRARRAPGLEQVVEVLGAAAAEERVMDRRAVRDLRPAGDRRRQVALGRLAEQVLLAQAAQPEAVGQAGGELGDAEVEEGEAPLDRVAHQHPVALRVQQVALEEGRDLQVLRARRAATSRRSDPAAAPRGGRGVEVAARGRALTRPASSRPRQRRGVREAQAVAVERVVGVRQAARVEAAQEAPARVEVVAEEAVQPREQQRPHARLAGRAPRNAARLSSRKMS